VPAGDQQAAKKSHRLRDCAMAPLLVTISLRQILWLMLLACSSSRSKDIEILVLRQEVDVLRRQHPRPQIRPEERLVLTVLQWLRPARERLSLLVTRTRFVDGTASSSSASGTSATGSIHPLDPSRGPARRPANGEGESDLGLPPHPRRALEGGYRHLGDIDPSHPRRRARSTRPQTRHLAPVPPCPGLLDRRL
jgi:hypothetical protein